VQRPEDHRPPEEIRLLGEKGLGATGHRRGRPKKTLPAVTRKPLQGLTRCPSFPALVHSKQAQMPLAGSSALPWPGKLHKSGSKRRSPAPPRPIQLHRSCAPQSPGGTLSSELARLRMVGKLSGKSVGGPRHLGLHSNGDLGYTRAEGRMGRGNAYQPPRRGRITASRTLCPSPMPIYPGRRKTKVHQSGRTLGRHYRPPKLPACCSRRSRATYLRLSSNVSRKKELDKSISANDGASPDPPQALRGQWHLPRLAVHSKCVQYLGRPPVT
jgi:hypothetical protein